MTDIAKLKLVKARIQAQLDASKAAGTYVSEADQQAAWERKVAAVLPRISASEADRGLAEIGSGDLTERLATSVERRATLKAIDSVAERWELWPAAMHALRELRDIVAGGRHRP